MRGELSNRMIASGTNALASSVVLACPQRTDDAPLATRREFIEALRTGVPVALKNLQHGSIAPVDLAQTAIGPSMPLDEPGARFELTRYLDDPWRAVIESGVSLCIP